MKIAVLLSGGVDSSTALFRLQKAGYTDITAFYLKIWLEDDLSHLGMCPWEEDLSYAQAVCKAAGVPLEVIPLQTQYHEKVVGYALEELRKGNTPSPDIFCNERVKFGAFFDEVKDRFDKVASGHYACLDWLPEGANPQAGGIDVLAPSAGLGKGHWRLLRAPDPVKDQTYFLSHLNQAQLSRICFPIGDLHKSKVREFAREWELANRDRPDSQGICFLGKIKYPDFVRYYLGEKDGDIVDMDTGEVLGTHHGSWFHTVGQRSGLALGNGPWYVAAKDMERNIVYVCHGDHQQEKLRTRLEITGFNWISGSPPDQAFLEGLNSRGLKAKLRHGPQLIECTLAPAAGRPGVWTVTLAEGDSGVAAGQFCVLYDGLECLGSGTILPPDAQELERLWTFHQEFQTRRKAAEAEARKQKEAKRREKQKRYGRQAGQ